MYCIFGSEARLLKEYQNIRYWRRQDQLTGRLFLFLALASRARLRVPGSQLGIALPGTRKTAGLCRALWLSCGLPLGRADLVLSPVDPRLQVVAGQCLSTSFCFVPWTGATPLFCTPSVPFPASFPLLRSYISLQSEGVRVPTTWASPGGRVLLLLWLDRGNQWAAGGLGCHLA